MICRDCDKETKTTCTAHLKTKRCKDCMYKLYKQYFYKDAERARVYTKTRNDNFYAKPECRARKLAYVKMRMKDNKEKWYAYCREWRKNNPEKMKALAERRKQYYIDNPEKALRLKELARKRYLAKKSCNLN